MDVDVPPQVGREVGHVGVQDRIALAAELLERGVQITVFPHVTLFKINPRAPRGLPSRPGVRRRRRAQPYREGMEVLKMRP